jgi:NADH-quinone oxidoreductase subunit J
MRDLLFTFFAVLTLAPALLVAVSRNPVNAAMSMIVALVGMAGLLVLLETYFLAILLALVYAGAIIVLFLFIIMLIDTASAPAPSLVAWFAGLSALALLGLGAWALAFSGESGLFARAGPDAPAAVARVFGAELFTRYMLPFQVTGFMLLIAMIGVVVLSRRVQGDRTDMTDKTYRSHRSYRSYQTQPQPPPPEDPS